MTKFLNISTDNTLGGSSASDVLVSSQKAVKDYVDANAGGLPSQTGHAGEYLTTNGTTASWSDAVGYHPDLFTFQWADHELNDTQWLRGDTFSWQDGTVYAVAYSHLTSDISGKSLSSETIAGTTVQFYLADDGHKVCPAAQESNVAAIYAATGVAWYYIVDTVNQRFKLPRTKFGMTGLRDTVGKYIAPGLPNITGLATSTYIWNNGSASGAFSYENGIPIAGTGSTVTSKNLKFNAADSNSIYGNSTTVQPPATQMYLYFYVGNFTQSALENTAGLNASLFNGKVDLNAANLSSAGKETVAHLAMPNNTYNDITVGVNGAQYTAPADGYFSVHGGSTANGGYVELVSDTKVEFGTSSSAQNGVVLRACITVSKGDIIRLWYSNAAFYHFRFYYANGAV